MSHTAKVFMTGRSQAVRLPAEYRFDCKEVYIHRDPLTGNLILSKQPDSWDDYFQLVAKLNPPQDFMSDRKDLPIQDRGDLF